MKNNLENAFRNSLQDYEAPYDPKAWEAVSSKLGVQPAAGSGMLSSVLKWGLATVLFGTFITGAFFLWDNQEEVNTSELINLKEETVTESNSKDTISRSNNQSDDEKVLTPLVEEQNKNTEETKKEEVNKVNTKKVRSTQNNSVPVIENQVNNEINKGQTTTKDNKESEVVADQFVSGSISAAVACEGESVVINNKNRKGIVKFQMNGRWIVLEPGKSFVLKPTSPMKIDFVNNENEVIETNFIKVQSLPSANFTYEANVYDEGLPVAICEAYGDYASYEWFFDNEIKRNGAEVKHNFFDKGDFEVTLKVIDRNGCESIAKKTVRIRDKYNLMAVDAFKPNGSDSRNRTFMPYSLTERDVKFQLTIVDPIDNSVVFTSNDANNAWDGIDQKTGKMTPDNKVYMWKVQIFDPLPNERPIYAGTIVHN